MCLGLPDTVAISSWLRTKVLGVPVASPLSVTVFMVVGLAAVKTSAGAPLTMLAASASLPAKLKTTLVPGCAASNCLPSVVKLSCSDAAAKTVTVPVMSEDPDADTEPDEEPDEELEEQPLRASRTAAQPPASRAVRVVTELSTLGAMASAAGAWPGRRGLRRA